MRARLKALERRLARVTAILRARADRAACADRDRENRALIALMARAGLAAAGIDSSLAVTLRHLDAPEPAPPQPPPRRTAEPPTLLDHLYALTARFHHGPPPNLASASPMALVGYYCFGDGVVEAPA